MNGVADWANKEPSSLLLKLVVSVTTFIGQAPFISTTNELTEYMFPLISTYVMDAHPAIVEIGITALSTVVQRLPTMVAAEYLSVMVHGVLSSFTCSLIDMDNSSSRPGSILRAVNRVLPLLEEQSMNSFAQKCLQLPTLPSPTSETPEELTSSSSFAKSHKELLMFLSVLRYLFLDSLPTCQHMATLYTTLLPQLIESLSNNTLIQTTTNVSNSTTGNAPSIYHVPSLSTVRLTLDTIQRLTSFQTVFEQHVDPRKQSLMMSSLWTVGRSLLPFLAKQIKQIQKQNYDSANVALIALIEATLTSSIGMLSTSMVLKHCPSSTAVLGLIKQVGNTMNGGKNGGGACLSSTKLNLGYYIYRILNEMHLQTMVWYENIKKKKKRKGNSGTSSSTTTTSAKDNKKHAWNVQLNKALRIIIEQLVSDTGIHDVAGSSSSSQLAKEESWALFHCGLNVARASMYVLDIDDVTKTVVPDYLLEYVTSFISGTSMELKQQPQQPLQRLSEDVLQVDERILMQRTTTNASGSNSHYQHPLLTSLASSKIRKASSENDGGVGMVQRRPSKRPRLDPTLTSALPMKLNNLLHDVRDGLEEIHEFVAKGNVTSAAAQNQLQQCVGKLQTLVGQLHDAK